MLADGEVTPEGRELIQGVDDAGDQPFVLGGEGSGRSGATVVLLTVPSAPEASVVR